MAVFVGVLLVLAAVFAVVTGDETFIGTALVVAALYAVYMVQFVRREKEEKPKEKQSPLMKR